MYKNIVFIHLESVNNITFRMQPQLFPNLYKIIDESICFQNYYSSATSTLMVIADLMYGNMYRNESSINMKEGYMEVQGMTSLFDNLRDRFGYHTGVILWPTLCDHERIVNRKIIGENIDYMVFDNNKQFKHSINEFIKLREPFALFIGSFATHIEYQKHARKRNADATMRWKDTREMLDELCGEVIEWLEQEQKIDDTIVVFYGDHGDDFWGHRLNNGYTHAVEPYANVISAPLIIHIPGYKGTHLRNELISTIDIKDIIFNLVEKDFKDIINVNSRKYIFSRNLYAGQKAKHLSLEKGYSVADEEYLLMVTFRGLEFYNNVLDPQNTCNLLEFYKMDKVGNIAFNLKFNELKSGHFLYYFRAVEIENMIRRYKILRKSLIKEVRKIYRVANINQDLVFQELAFNKICDRHGYRFYNHKIVKWIESK